jgi:HAE1 family hydrophobic/amphiphilic exporter-1
MAESFGYAVSALAMAILFIYMILASQFKSFLQPLALMTSLPLTLIGVVLALLLFRSTLSMFSIIGVVMLMGLVTKNAILLVDFAHPTGWTWTATAFPAWSAARPCCWPPRSGCAPS